jgi:hypothetical protein
VPPDKDTNTSEDKGPEVVSSPAMVQTTATPPVDAPTGPVNKSDEEMHAEATAPVDQTPPAMIGSGAPAQTVVVATKQPATKSEKPRGQSKFLSLTGVKEEDLLSYNPQNLTGVTAQGGKYQMNTKGTQIRHLAGPRPPSVTDEEAQAEEEARREAAENARAARGE